MTNRVLNQIPHRAFERKYIARNDCILGEFEVKPDILRGREVQLIWDVDALFAWTLDEFEDYLASERYALPTTPRIAATEDLGLPVVDIPSEALRKGNEWFGSQGGGLYGPLDLKYLELT